MQNKEYLSVDLSNFVELANSHQNSKHNILLKLDMDLEITEFIFSKVLKG